MRRFLLIFGFAVSANAQRIAPEKWIPSFVQWQNPFACPMSEAAAQSMAKFDMVKAEAGFSVCKPSSYTGTIWSYMKTFNPDQVATSYLNGPGQFGGAGPTIGTGANSTLTWMETTHGTNCVGVNCRWTALGNNTQGNTGVTGFLRGNRQFCGNPPVVCDDYSDTMVMRLQNTDWLDWWISNGFSTLNGRANNAYPGFGAIDTTGLDGLFADNTNHPVPPSYQTTGSIGSEVIRSGDPFYLDTPSDYAGAWDIRNVAFQDAALIFADRATANLGHIFTLNWMEDPRDPYWAKLDGKANPPYAGLTECLGACLGRAEQSLTDGSVMPGIFDAILALRHTRVMFDNVVPAICNDLSTLYPGVGSNTCGDILLYQMAVFMFGFDTTVGNAFFGWTDASYTGAFPDELDPNYIHLGNQVGSYFHPTTSTPSDAAYIYCKQFDDGWICANTNSSTVSGISVPSGTACTVDHSNFKSLPANLCSTGAVSTFSMQRQHGIILLKPGKDITCADNGGCLAPVGTPTLAITTNSPLPTGTVGASYSYTLAATGGTAPYTWAVTVGSLPTGLALASGVISGTPSGSPGASTFTLRVTDSAAATDSKSFSLTISAASSTSGQVTSDAFTNSSTACLSSYDAHWVLVQDGGGVNCLKVDAATDVAFPAVVDYYGLAARRSEVHGEDQGASIAITAMPADSTEGAQFIGVGTHLQGTATTRSLCGVVVYKSGTTQYTSVYDFVSGSYASLGFTTAVTWAANDVIRMDTLAGVISVQQNGTAVAAINSLNLACPVTGGTPGLLMSGAGLTVSGDNWKSYNNITATLPVIYLSTGGNDVNNGQLPTAAVLTPDHARSLLGGGGKIEVCDNSCDGIAGAGGTYTTAITGAFPNGSSGAPTVIEAYPGETVSFTPSAGCNPGKPTGDYLTLKNVTLDATNVSGCTTGALQTITLGTTVSGSQGTGSVTRTLASVTIPNQTNRLLLLAIVVANNAASVSNCKFNTSESMTQIVELSGVNYVDANLWYLKQPTVTTASVVCTITDMTVKSQMIAVPMYNVYQTTPIRGSLSAAGGGVTSGTLTLTTVSGDLAVDLTATGAYSTPGITPAGSQSEKADISNTDNNTELSTLAATTTSTGVSASWTDNITFVHLAAAIEPAPVTAPSYALDVGATMTHLVLDGVKLKNAADDCGLVNGTGFQFISTTSGNAEVSTCGAKGLKITAASAIVNGLNCHGATGACVSVEANSADIRASKIHASGVGVQNVGAVTGLTLINDEIYSNTGDGLSMATGTPTGAQALNITFYGNGAKNWNMSGSGHVIKNSCSVGGGSGDTSTGVTATTNSTTCTFVNAPSDLHLSAAFAGTDLSATFTTDKDGITRSTWDKGAYEFRYRPTVTQMLPLNTPRAHAAIITFTGTGFSGTSPTIVFSGTGIVASGISVLSDTSLTATLTVASNAAPSCQTVTVTTNNGVGTTGYSFCASAPYYFHTVLNQ